MTIPDTTLSDNDMDIMYQ